VDGATPIFWPVLVDESEYQKASPAPMLTGEELRSKVTSNRYHGGFGKVGAADSNPDTLEEAIAEVRAVPREPAESE
jgi:hypothetical protein